MSEKEQVGDFREQFECPAKLHFFLEEEIKNSGLTKKQILCEALASYFDKKKDHGINEWDHRLSAFAFDKTVVCANEKCRKEIPAFTLAFHSKAGVHLCLDCGMDSVSGTDNNRMRRRIKDFEDDRDRTLMKGELKELSARLSARWGLERVQQLTPMTEQLIHQMAETDKTEREASQLIIDGIKHGCLDAKIDNEYMKGIREFREKNKENRHVLETMISSCLTYRRALEIWFESRRRYDQHIQDKHNATKEQREIEDKLWKEEKGWKE